MLDFTILRFICSRAVVRVSFFVKEAPLAGAVFYIARLWSPKPISPVNIELQYVKAPKRKR